MPSQTTPLTRATREARGGERDEAGELPSLALPDIAVRASTGRRIYEHSCPTRNEFQRDRDRIVHSSAFRRLTHKTQVFIYHEGDHYRSRLTHSLEVAQIARAIARQLDLDEDLAEAIALAHDLGHPPFGHAGERALDREMRDFGGFDHNAQSLKVVTSLERKYASFDGINLTRETLEGIVKHNGPWRAAAPCPAAATAASEGCETPDIPSAIQDFDTLFSLNLETFASAEAQAAAIADDIAYNNHDLDDGLRAGLLDLDDLHNVPLTHQLLGEVRALHGPGLGNRAIYEVNRRLITAMVVDVVDEARRRIGEDRIASARDVALARRTTVTFSGTMNDRLNALRQFLFSTVYRDERVMDIMTDAEGVVRDLFRYFMDAPRKLPESWADVAAQAALQQRADLICDYVAGMTDRFAIQEHRRLFDATPELR